MYFEVTAADNSAMPQIRDRGGGGGFVQPCCPFASSHFSRPCTLILHWVGWAYKYNEHAHKDSYNKADTQTYTLNLLNLT